jgi:predicted ATP-grasp superfamily ATP-dependent carboligase
VLDANQRSALAVTRSLGRAGARVFTADATATALAGCSRHSERYLRCPSPAREPRQFLQWLSDAATEHAIDWIFPVTEISSQLILLEAPPLGNARLPFAELAQVMSLADKWEIVQLAERTGVPHPRSRRYADAAAFHAAHPTPPSAFPLVLKPTQSRRWLGDGWLDTSVHVAYSADDLQRLLRDKRYLRDFPFMVQEFVEGHGAGVFALYDRGRPVTFFAHERLREKPPRGGVSVLSQSVALTPELQAMAKQLLDAAGWHGVAMVEFRVTPTGAPYLMEINTRFWGSLQLAIDAGVDFPALLLRLSRGESIAALPPYRVGRRLRWLLGDVDSLYIALRDPDFSVRDKLARVIAFMTPRPFATRHEVNRLDDLGPARHELRAWLQALRGQR